jgi:UDP-glucose 4-epimerase
MRVLVTGAAGFLGRHLSSFLRDSGQEVIALDKKEEWPAIPGVRPISADICDEEAIKGFVGGLDAVVHLAALAAPSYCDSHPQECFETNVRGTFNVLRLAHLTGAKRFIFASTAHVYGISPRYFPTDENHPLWMQDTYTTSKILGEQLCQLFYVNHNLSYLTMRQFNGFGPGQSPGFFVPDMIRKAMEEKKIVLGGGNITKDFIYVSDMVEAMVGALHSDYVGGLNVGRGVQTELREVATIIADYFDVPLELRPNEKGGPTRMQADTSRIEKVLGWHAKVPLGRGLDATLCNLPRRQQGYVSIK